MRFGIKEILLRLFYLDCKTDTVAKILCMYARANPRHCLKRAKQKEGHSCRGRIPAPPVESPVINLNFITFLLKTKLRKYKKVAQYTWITFRLSLLSILFSVI